MSSGAAPTIAPTPAAGPAGAQPLLESCPLCGTPLRAGQEWCLNCGAAARTRLAAAPNWRGPLVAILLIAALALGVLAAALVKLAGDSGPAPAPTTMTVTSPLASTSAPATTPGAVTTPTSATTPTTATTPSTATTPTTATTAPGATSTASPGAGAAKSSSEGAPSK